MGCQDRALIANLLEGFEEQASFAPSGPLLDDARAIAGSCEAPLKFVGFETPVAQFPSRRGVRIGDLQTDVVDPDPGLPGRIQEHIDPARVLGNVADDLVLPPLRVGDRAVP